MEGPLLQFHAGSPIIVAGPTGTGKTNWIYKLLVSKNMFTKPIDSILYCYGVYQPIYNEMRKIIPNITFLNRLPTSEEIDSLNDGNFHLIILDDLMEYVVKSVETENLFTKKCHHYGITTIYVTQNLFAQGKNHKTTNINTHYLCLFANKRDESQVMCIGKQVSPYDNKAFVEAYFDATYKMFGYLLIDCDPKSKREFKFRTKIFPGEDTEIYLSKRFNEFIPSCQIDVIERGCPF